MSPEPSVKYLRAKAYDTGFVKKWRSVQSAQDINDAIQHIFNCAYMCHLLFSLNSFGFLEVGD